jgi:hypothetical protein
MSDVPPMLRATQTAPASVLFEYLETKRMPPSIARASHEPLRSQRGNSFSTPWRDWAA